MVCDSDNTGWLTTTLMLLRRGSDMRTHDQHKTENLDPEASQYENVSNAGLFQENDG